MDLCVYITTAVSLSVSLALFSGGCLCLLSNGAEYSVQQTEIARALLQLQWRKLSNSLILFILFKLNK